MFVFKYDCYYGEIIHDSYFLNSRNKCFLTNSFNILTQHGIRIGKQVLSFLFFTDFSENYNKNDVLWNTYFYPILFNFKRPFKNIQHLFSHLIYGW